MQHRLAVLASTLIAFGAASAARAEDLGPVEPDGKPTYENYRQFRRDLELACYAEELSGADKLTDPQQRAARTSGWLSAQTLGPDFKKMFEAVASVHPLDKGIVLLAAAGDASLGRCPLAEADLHRTSIDLRTRCDRGDAGACKQRSEFLELTAQSIDKLSESSVAECKRGRRPQCALQRQYEQMKHDVRAGAPLPRAPRRLRSSPYPAGP